MEIQIQYTLKSIEIFNWAERLQTIALSKRLKDIDGSPTCAIELCPILQYQFFCMKFVRNLSGAMSRILQRSKFGDTKHMKLSCV
jgi:hypothetical protein